jgi:uncharacterized membrane protein YeaQ/YmgE (transglycosylase-associated protein family)
VIVRIAVFLVFSLFVVLLVFALIVGAVTHFLVPGGARRSWFKSMDIGAAGSVVGGRVASALSVVRRRYAAA